MDAESREGQKRLRCDVSSTIETAHTSLSDTIIIVAHGGTIMALMDQLSEPHKDYFDWQEAGRGNCRMVRSDSGWDADCIL